MTRVDACHHLHLFYQHALIMFATPCWLQLKVPHFHMVQNVLLTRPFQSQERLPKHNSIMTYFERTYNGLRESLARALAPGHFPVFTRAKNPNRLHGTRTGLTLDALKPYGAVDVSLWRPEDVPHGRQGYALKPPTKKDIKIAVKALKRSLAELEEEWDAFRARGGLFVVCGIAQLKTLTHVPEMVPYLKDAFVFYACKWIMGPAMAYSAVVRAVNAAGKRMVLAEFTKAIEIAASASALDFYANESEEHRAARIQSQLDFYANESEEHRAARIQSALDFYANESEEHRAARIQSALDFAANESAEHRKARVDTLKSTIACETAEKRSLRIKNLNAKLKSPEKQAELKAKYRFTIGSRCRATIMNLRERRFLKRSLESPEEQYDRRLRAVKHIENWKAARKIRTDEQRAIEKANRKAAWNERRGQMRAKKAAQLLMNLDIMDAVTRAYHYQNLKGHKKKCDIREDPFGAQLMAFYDAHPGTLEKDKKAYTADCTAKLKAGNYASQKAFEEKKRVEKWGPDHAKMTRGDKLKMAFAANKKKVAESPAAEETAVEEPKEKWPTQKKYRERKKEEAKAIAEGLPLEGFAIDPMLAARGKKIAEAWAKKRTAKEAGLVEDATMTGTSSSSASSGARPPLE